MRTREHSSSGSLWNLFLQRPESESTRGLPAFNQSLSEVFQKTLSGFPCCGTCQVPRNAESFWLRAGLTYCSFCLSKGQDVESLSVPRLRPVRSMFIRPLLGVSTGQTPGAQRSVRYCPYLLRVEHKGIVSRPRDSQSPRGLEMTNTWVVFGPLQLGQLLDL